MEFPKEAAAMDSPHMSPPAMTTGRLPKRFTSMLLMGPATVGGEKRGKSHQTDSRHCGEPPTRLTCATSRTKGTRWGGGRPALAAQPTHYALAVIMSTTPLGDQSTIKQPFYMLSRRRALVPLPELVTLQRRVKNFFFLLSLGLDIKSNRLKTY